MSSPTPTRPAPATRSAGRTSSRYSITGYLSGPAVNVQHIESLSDVVEDFSEVQIRERVPDSVLDRADEIRLIDIAPRDLVARLEEGAGLHRRVLASGRGALLQAAQSRRPPGARPALQRRQRGAGAPGLRADRRGPAARERPRGHHHRRRGTLSQLGLPYPLGPGALPTPSGPSGSPSTSIRARSSHERTGSASRPTSAWLASSAPRPSSFSRRTSPPPSSRLRRPARPP